MIITIDGPAGAGKSSVARALARRLGFRFLDTGAMYRAVALAGMRRGLDWGVPQDLARLARELRFTLAGERLLLDGEDVTEAVRTTAVTAVTRYAADNPQVRQRLVELQRILAGQDNVVTEGRDQGTVAFPHAECKIFLTASPQERPGGDSATYNLKESRCCWNRCWPPKSGAIKRTRTGRLVRWCLRPMPSRYVRME